MIAALRAPFLFALLLAAVAALAPALAIAADPAMVTHRDSRHGFRLDYPGDWRPVAFKDGPEFQALANDGRGPEECNVNVTSVSGPAYLDRVTREQMLGNLRAAMKDAEFVEWRRQTLAQRWGLYYIVTGTTPRQAYKQTTLGYQVVVGAKLFTLSCSAPAAGFEARRPTFERILASLSF